MPILCAPQVSGGHANSLRYAAASLDKKHIAWNEERTGDRRGDNWQEEVAGGVLVEVVALV